MRRIAPRVIAEGRIRTPDQAAEALRHGAWAVVVGSAITRPEHVTGWFRAALAAETSMTVLALDIGGTKLLAALVTDGRVVEEARVPTDISEGPDRLLDAAATLAAPWRGRYRAIGAAVTGLVRDGRWRTLNAATLDLRDWVPLADGLAARLGTPVRCVNDAHAAAWGEYLRGAGAGHDMVFLTVSTGIGGGIVLRGRLLEGLAGSFGQLVDETGVRIEDRAAGRWMAAQAAAAGHPTDAAGVFAAAGAPWADRILDAAAARASLPSAATCSSRSIPGAS